MQKKPIYYVEQLKVVAPAIAIVTTKTLDPYLS